MNVWSLSRRMGAMCGDRLPWGEAIVACVRCVCADQWICIKSRVSVMEFLFVFGMVLVFVRLFVRLLIVNAVEEK